MFFPFTIIHFYYNNSEMLFDRFTVIRRYVHSGPDTFSECFDYDVYKL